MEKGFEWVPFFEELAQEINRYRNDQSALIAILRNAGVEKGLSDESPKGSRVPLVEIDPFSFFSLIIKYRSFGERAARLTSIKSQLELKSEVPVLFNGVPSSDPRKAWLFPFKYERGQ